jgi:hypothetical protein
VRTQHGIVKDQPPQGGLDAAAVDVHARPGFQKDFLKLSPVVYPPHHFDPHGCSLIFATGLPAAGSRVSPPLR